MTLTLDWRRRYFSAVTFAAYVVAQLVAGALAALLSFVLWPAAKPVAIEVGPAFLVEALWTFVLVYVVLNVATSKANVNNSFYGLAIGSTVFVGAVAVVLVDPNGLGPADEAVYRTLVGTLRRDTRDVVMLQDFLAACRAARS